MTTYRYSVPGRIEGTAYCVKELVEKLRDDGCVKRMSVTTLCSIIDTTEKGGCYVGRYSDDSRYEFEIIRERD